MEVNRTQAGLPAIIYAAKSTTDLRGSIPTQIADCQGLVAERDDCFLAAEPYVDEAFSAFTSNRGPGLAAARSQAEALAREHGGCVLVVQHSDRLARGDGKQAPHLVEYVLWAMKSGITLTSVQDPDAFKDVLFAALMGYRNTEDSRRKSESVKSGMRRRAVTGLHIGGRRRLGYEYTHVNRAPMKIVESERPTIVRIYAEFAAGRALKAIARGLDADGHGTANGGRWSSQRVADIIDNPFYMGFLRTGEDMVRGQHEPIISEEIWRQAQALRKLMHAEVGKGRGRPTGGLHLFTGGSLRCGSPLHGDTHPRMVPRVYPKGRQVYRCEVPGCPLKPIRRELIDEAVFAHFAQVGLDVEATRNAINSGITARLNEIGTLRQQAEREAHRATERLSRVRRDYQDGKLDADDWRDQRKQLETELEAATAELARLRDRERAERLTLQEIDQHEALERMARLRAAVAGEIHDAEGIRAVRVAIRRLFDAFYVVPQEGLGNLPNLPGLFEGDQKMGASLFITPELRGGLFYAIRSDSLGTDGEIQKIALAAPRDKGRIGLAWRNANGPA